MHPHSLLCLGAPGFKQLYFVFLFDYFWGNFQPLYVKGCNVEHT